MREVTLTQFLAAGQKAHSQATGEFTDILNRIALCAKLVGRQLRRAPLTGKTGYAETSNVYGERQEKLDVLANEIFLHHLQYGSLITLAASEEMDEPRLFSPAPGHSHYAICFDPIDGSSNLDVNGTLGTIFGIRRRAGNSPAGDLLTSGHEQVAAGYILYGPATEMIFTLGGDVAGFTLDPESGEFFLTRDKIEMPLQGKGYAVNEGNSRCWKPGVRQFVEQIKANHATRYSGSLVGDFHRILLQGGIYLYPEDVSDPAKPKGKLRVLYECHPLAMVAERAGGRASTGTQKILDITPDSFHARTPLAIGSETEVTLYEKFVSAPLTI